MLNSHLRRTDMKKVNYILGFCLGASGLINCIVALILYISGGNNTSIMVFSILGCSFLFTSIIQLIIGYTSSKNKD